MLYPQADGTASGTLDASYVPQIMLPAPGYENIAGGWEQTPNTDPNGITGDVTYVYRFGSTGGGSSSGHSTRYTLHYESNGGTAYKDERCSSGTKVTLDKTPTRESYTFTGWYADKALTQKITSVTMNSDKTVYAGWEATGVPDKLNGDDHFAYVVGYSDSTVRPSANISRAEVATIFFRLLKSDIRDGNLTADNVFSDVSDSQWHNKAISTMAKLGIVKGRRADRFDPDASITRAEFAAICARRPDAMLLCVGRGSLMDEIRAKSETLGISDRVIFAGAQKDTPAYYSAMDVFLFPSLYEGLGSVLIEAQANGLTVITTQTVVPRDVDVTGRAAFVPLEAPAETWAEAVLSAPARETDGRSAETVKALYDIQSVAQTLCAIYCREMGGCT